MTAFTFNLPRKATVAMQIKSFVRSILDVLDAFAEYRMRHAVPESELRRAAREINRYRGLMHSKAQ